MKRLHILTKPIKTTEIADIEAHDYEDKWLLKAEKLQTKRYRKFRQSMAS